MASEEEIAELEELYEDSDLATVKDKVNEYMERVPDAEQQELLNWTTECEKLWGLDQAQEILADEVAVTDEVPTTEGIVVRMS